MYVPNTSKIPTNRVNLWHHGLKIWERTQESPIKSSQGEERRKKKEREENKEEGLVPYALFCAGVTPNDIARLFHESH
jgi:hypothetical protein